MKVISKVGGSVKQLEEAGMDYLRDNIPALNATEPHSGSISEKYVFIPTDILVGMIKETGWIPYQAKSQKSRKYPKEQALHRIDFRPDNYKEFGQQYPRMVMINSHNGQSSLKLLQGIFRILCENGLIIGDMLMQPLMLRHINITQEAVFELVAQFTEKTVESYSVVEKWKSIPVNADEITYLASQAAKLRFDDPSGDDVNNLMTMRRPEDNNHDLWSQFNVVQENLLRGGFKRNNRKVREIKSIQADLKLNQQLWNLYAEFAQKS